MKTKWCEKCNAEFEWEYTIYELHNDNVAIPIDRELKRCPHCNGKLTELEEWNERIKKHNR